MKNALKNEELTASQIKARGFSMATKPDINPYKLVAEAKKKCRIPIKLSWQNIYMEVDMKTTEKERAQQIGTGRIKRQAILKRVSGFAAPGTATYIMGSSGAGKTTLMNILSDRVKLKNNEVVSGTILINDTIAVNKANFSRFAGYVQQDDILFDQFTVREAL